jgi:hypothetical protein
MFCVNCGKQIPETGICDCGFEAPYIEERKDQKGYRRYRKISCFMVFLGAICAFLTLSMCFSEDGILHTLVNEGIKHAGIWICAICFFVGSLAIIAIPVLCVIFVLLASKQDGHKAYRVGFINAVISSLAPVLLIITGIIVSLLEVKISYSSYGIDLGTISVPVKSALLSNGEESLIIIPLFTIPILIYGLLTYRFIKKNPPSDNGPLILKRLKGAIVVRESKARSATELFQARAKQVVTGSLMFIREFFKAPVSAIQTYSLELKEALAFIGIHALGAAISMLILTFRGREIFFLGSFLQALSYRKAELFFGTFFISLFSSAFIAGIVWLLNRIIKGILGDKGHLLKILSTAAVIQFPVMAAFIIAIPLGLLSAHLLIILFIVGFLTSILLTFVIYRTIFEFSDDQSLFATIIASASQIAIIVMLESALIESVINNGYNLRF